MASLYLSQYDEHDGLGEFFLKSFLVHAISVLIIVALSWVLGLEGRRIHSENIVLVEGSVRVDVVAMPRMTVKELQSLQELAARGPVAPAVKVEEKKPEAAPVPVVADNSKAPVLEKAADEAPRESVMDVLRRTAKREVPAAQAPAPAETEQAGGGGLSADAQRRLRELVAAGNRLADGSSIVGGGQGSELTEFNVYILALPDLVRSHWRLPSFLRDQELRARVRIYLRPTGELIRAELFESSGNEEYDRRAIEAVRSASPFPQLSQEIAARGQRGDIVLGFPL
jgi:colicin import membrane protein